MFSSIGSFQCVVGWNLFYGQVADPSCWLCSQLQTTTQCKQLNRTRDTVTWGLLKQSMQESAAEWVWDLDLWLWIVYPACDSACSNLAAIWISMCCFITSSKYKCLFIELLKRHRFANMEFNVCAGRLVFVGRKWMLVLKLYIVLELLTKAIPAQTGIQVYFYACVCFAFWFW